MLWLLHYSQLLDQICICLESLDSFSLGHMSEPRVINEAILIYRTESPAYVR